MSSRRSSRSFWELLRAGKLDEREVDELGLTAGGYGAQRALIRRALVQRARWITGKDKLRKNRASVIVKQVSTARSRAAVNRIARYIGRLGVAYDGDPGIKRQGLHAEDLSSDRVPSTSQAPEQKTPSQTMLVAAYGDRARKPSVYDQWGVELRRDQMLERIQGWPILDDGENLSPQGQQALETGGRKALDALEEDDAFAQVQALHIVISVPEDDIDPARRFEEIVRRFMRTTFGAFGCEALVTFHIEHGRAMHAHVLVATVKPVSLLIEGHERRGQRQGSIARFALDRFGFMADALRLALAEEASKEGFAVDGSRREDRAEMRRLILAGHEPLRPKPTARSFDDDLSIPGFAELPPIFRRIVRQVPIFAAGHAEELVRNIAEFESRRGQRPEVEQPAPPNQNETEMGFFRRLLGPKKAVTAEPTPPVEGGMDANDDAQLAALHALRDWLRARKMFTDRAGGDGTDQAIRNWRRIRAENRSFADWALVRTPQLFGSVTPGERDRLDEAELKRLIRAVNQDQVGIGGRRDLDELLADVPKELLEAHMSELRALTVEKLHKALDSSPAAYGDVGLARQGQAGIVRSFTQLAWGLHEALPNDHEAAELEQAIRIMAGRVAKLEVPIGIEDDISVAVIDETADEIAASERRAQESAERQRLRNERLKSQESGPKEGRPRKRDDEWDR
jgi:hypothetical protein